jgi:hypothetical protein
VLVLNHFADELSAALAEPRERLVDVVHGEHDACREFWGQPPNSFPTESLVVYEVCYESPFKVRRRSEPTSEREHQGFRVRSGGRLDERLML